ncbi:c-type cytochrome [bacterium]|nr:c-type cytochrome [bacterium]
MKEEDKVRHHSYDGIQEYDNMLPRWWVGTFVITVVFGFCYWLYYNTYAVGPTQEQEYQTALEEHKAEFGNKGGDEGPTDAALLAKSQDSHETEEGKKIFMTNCMACHGDKGQGVIGPNLTDKYWIHGGKPTQIHATVTNGVVEKGMLSWKGVLAPNQIDEVVAFIMTLQGTNPPGAKEPQGDLVE